MSGNHQSGSGDELLVLDILALVGAHEPRGNGQNLLLGDAGRLFGRNDLDSAKIQMLLPLLGISLWTSVSTLKLGRGVWQVVPYSPRLSANDSGSARRERCAYWWEGAWCGCGSETESESGPTMYPFLQLAPIREAFYPRIGYVSCCKVLTGSPTVHNYPTCACIR